MFSSLSLDIIELSAQESWNILHNLSNFFLAKEVWDTFLYTSFYFANAFKLKKGCLFLISGLKNGFKNSKDF